MTATSSGTPRGLQKNLDLFKRTSTPSKEPRHLWESLDLSSVDVDPSKRTSTSFPDPSTSVLDPYFPSTEPSKAVFLTSTPLQTPFRPPKLTSTLVFERPPLPNSGFRTCVLG